MYAKGLALLGHSLIQPVDNAANALLNVAPVQPSANVTNVLRDTSYLRMHA